MAGTREQVVLLVLLLLCLHSVDAGWYMSYTSFVKLNYHVWIYVFSCFTGLVWQHTRCISIMYCKKTVCLFVTQNMQFVDLDFYNSSSGGKTSVAQ